MKVNEVVLELIESRMSWFKWFKEQMAARVTSEEVEESFDSLPDFFVVLRKLV